MMAITVLYVKTSHELPIDAALKADWFIQRNTPSKFDFRLFNGEILPDSEMRFKVNVYDPVSIPYTKKILRNLGFVVVSEHMEITGNVQ